MPREIAMVVGVRGAGALVEPGRPITLGARSLVGAPFRPTRIVVSDPDSWAIESLKISGVEQLSGVPKELAGMPIPASVLACAPLLFEIVAPGVEVELKLTNVSTVSRMVGAELRGWGAE